MLTIYAHLVSSLRVAAAHTRCWTTPSRSTRRSWRDCVFSHEILSRVAPLPLTVREGDTEVCSLFTRVWSVYCVRWLHTLGAGPLHLDPLADLGEIAFSVTRFDLASPHCHSQYGRVIIELCSLLTRIWSNHCVWRLHTISVGPHHLDTPEDRA